MRISPLKFSLSDRSLSTLSSLGAGAEVIELDDQKLGECQKFLVESWRRVKATELRVAVEDLILDPGLLSRSPAGRLRSRVSRLVTFVYTNLIHGEGRVSLLDVFELLAQFLWLHETEVFRVTMEDFINKLSLSKKQEVPGYLEYTNPDEFEILFGTLITLCNQTAPQDRGSRPDTLLSAIVMASSRGALVSGSQALKHCKSDMYSAETLDAEMAKLDKLRAQEYSSVTDFGYLLTINALGFALIKCYAQFPENWGAVREKLAHEVSTVELKHLAYGVREALRAGGPKNWPSETDYAGDLVELLTPLISYARHVECPQEARWQQIADVLERAQTELSAIQTGSV